MRWTLLALLYMAGLFVLSSIPDEEGGIGRKILFPPPQVQNLLHAPVYAGLCWLWWRALRARGLASPRAALLAAAIATGYGALDELHQMLVPGRFASVTDALLNAAGAGIVAGWCWFAVRDAPARSGTA